MSDQFYNYLANRLRDFFLSRNILHGDKFHIQFEKEEQVRNLYQSMKGLKNSMDFVYSTDVAAYNTYALQIKGINLIVAATLDGVSPDWLTHLRNKVITNEAQFTEAAILFIHDTTLDSITGGTEGLQKEGMPLHVKSIIKDIKERIKSSALPEYDKNIIKLTIEKKRKQIFEDNTSIFEYQNLLKSISYDEISRDQYKDFGLFYDGNLSEVKGRELKKRLEENFELFQKVDNIHKYRSPDIDLEKDFDQKGAGFLQRDDWKEVEYKDVKQSLDNKNKIKDIEYIENNKKQNAEGIVYWERAEGSTKVKSRFRNIIVFNKDCLNTVQLEFRFDSNLKKDFLKSSNGMTAETSGKRIKALINPVKNATTFCSLTYKDLNVRFEFRIALVECNESVLENIKTYYTIKPKDKQIIVNSEEQEIVINSFGTEQVEEELTSYNDHKVEFNEQQQLTLVRRIQIPDDDKDYIKVNLKFQNTVIPLSLREYSEKPVVVTGMTVWRLKRENKESFQCKGENKLIQGTREYFAREDFRCNLKREEEIISSGSLFYQEAEDGLKGFEIEVNREINKTYQDLIQYFKVNRLIPSLAYLTDELKQLYIIFVQAFINAVDQIPSGTSLVTHHKNLIKVGTIEKVDGEREILFTPLHPLNLAYQIVLNERVEQEKLPDELLKRLSPVNLLPYTYHDFKKLYKPVEQTHSPEWNYYVHYKLQRYNGSRNFVAKLVQEKIEEFINHFGYLFSLSKQSPLLINLVNLGDCKEVLQGLFNFYFQEINSQNIEELIPIELFIYSKGNVTTAFEEISLYDDPKIIKEIFGLNLENGKYSDNDVLNIFREKVHFYIIESRPEKYQYAHITFYQMGETVEESYAKMKDVYTGISMGGLMSGVPSVYDGETYKAGFGTKYLKENKNYLLALAVRLNALALKSNTVNPYDSEECIVMAISNDCKYSLNKIYDASHWVTFIDPKVNLNFFKNDPNNSDLLIIHYSDQYTSSSSYDAITVTRRSKQYQLIIEEFLREKGFPNADNYSPDIINLFNSVNGDWLLRLISDKGQFSREKLSILSAIKISLAYFYHPNILWIPISLEEILRVSGGAGLKKSEGLFSAKNLGKKGLFSDDLLLVGFEEKDGEVEVYYYPVEVKIGNNDSGVINKAIEQVQKTRKLLEDSLSKEVFELSSEGVFTRTMYRDFLIQLAIVSAEKMKLYDVWPEQDWDIIINSTIREKLLADDYKISNRLDQYIGKGAVISFKKDIHFKNEHMENNVLILDLTEQDGYSNITPSIETLKEKYVKGETDLDQKRLLHRTYSSRPIEAVPSHFGQTAVPVSVNPNVVPDETTVQPREVKVEPTKPLEILFGLNQENNKLVKWFPTSTDKIMHTNTGIIGTMGSGKTQFTKSVIAQLNRNQVDNVNNTPLGILIFDYKGDYIKKDFIDVTKAKVLNLFHLPFNPLALYLTENPKPLLPLHTASGLVETIATGYGLGVKQQTTLQDLIMEAYEKRGIHKANRDTWSKVAPTINDVFRVYELNDDIKKDDSLYSALNKLYEYEIFEPDSGETKTLFDVINGVTVINLSGYDESIQNLVVAITLDIFYNQMQMSGHSHIEGNYREIKKMVLVDEADNFLSKEFKSLKKILKEGREFGVGTILSTQLLSHFSTTDNEYANYILTWVIHNVSDINNKDIRYIFNTSSKAEEDNILNQIKKLQKHFSIISIGAGSKPMHIKDKAFWELVLEMED